MRQPLPRKIDGIVRTSRENSGGATETDPLLSSQAFLSADGIRKKPTATHHHGSIRERRSSRSPAVGENPMSTNPPGEMPHDDEYTQTYNSTDASYELHIENISQPSRSQHAGEGASRASSSTRDTQHPSVASQERPIFTMRRSRGVYRPSATDNSSHGSLYAGDTPPLIEIPEEVYAVRKAALQVMKPLTASWLVVSVGFAVSVLLGMARWSRLIDDLPYWFILLPSWFSHVGLLYCHITSAKALSKFIAEANDNRQRPDSTDHLDRQEYLPLLQRSLKFGLKTGLLSFCTFIFEVLMCVRIARGTVSLLVAFIPLWLLVGGGIIDGVVCKTQHFVRVLCWILIFTAMVLAVLKMDYGIEEIRWRVVITPIVAVLSICSATLIYIVYGHQVGYYRLTEAQLTAGILYSMSALICIVLVVVVGEVMPLSRPIELETRFFFIVMAPLVVCLVGMGAWAVSRDEFGRLLLYGGQAAVHPMKLRWEKHGWTSVQSKGVTIIPMFGEVSFRPLPRKKSGGIELSSCCSCYPYEDDDEMTVNYPENVSWRNHPYLAPTSPRTSLPRGQDNVSLDMPA